MVRSQPYAEHEFQIAILNRKLEKVHSEIAFLEKQILNASERLTKKLTKMWAVGGSLDLRVNYPNCPESILTWYTFCRCLLDEAEKVKPRLSDSVASHFFPARKFPENTNFYDKFKIEFNNLLKLLDELLTRNNWAADLMYQKLKGICQNQSLRTFRALPNFQVQFKSGLPWNFYNGGMNHPRPVRFLYLMADDPNLEERNYLNGTMRREDMDLFCRLVGVENVPRYFRWTLWNLRRVSAGELDFDDMPEDKQLIF